MRPYGRNPVEPGGRLDGEEGIRVQGSSRDCRIQVNVLGGGWWHGRLPARSFGRSPAASRRSASFSPISNSAIVFLILVAFVEAEMMFRVCRELNQTDVVQVRIQTTAIRPTVFASSGLTSCPFLLLRHVSLARFVRPEQDVTWTNNTLPTEPFQFLDGRLKALNGEIRCQPLSVVVADRDIEVDSATKRCPPARNVRIQAVREIRAHQGGVESARLVTVASGRVDYHAACL